MRWTGRKIFATETSRKKVVLRQAGIISMINSIKKIKVKLQVRQLQLSKQGRQLPIVFRIDGCKLQRAQLTY